MPALHARRRPNDIADLDFASRLFTFLNEAFTEVPDRSRERPLRSERRNLRQGLRDLGRREALPALSPKAQRC